MVRHKVVYETISEINSFVLRSGKVRELSPILLRYYFLTVHTPRRLLDSLQKYFHGGLAKSKR